MGAGARRRTGRRRRQLARPRRRVPWGDHRDRRAPGESARRAAAPGVRSRRRPTQDDRERRGVAEVTRAPALRPAPRRSPRSPARSAAAPLDAEPDQAEYGHHHGGRDQDDDGPLILLSAWPSPDRSLTPPCGAM